ncbi:MAG: hypothetical protein IKT40_12010 [Bacilli bacterium]|nr:hypothetical protein [Bacilli bacterium]
MGNLKIRGIKHLARVLDPSQPRRIMFFNGKNVFDGYVVKHIDECNRYHILYLNNKRGNTNFSYFDFKNLYEKHPYLTNYYSLFEMNDSISYRIFGNHIILLDENFNDIFENVISQNKKLLSPYLDVLNRDYAEGKYIFSLFYNSPNLLAWALKQYFKQGLGINTIVSVSNWNNKYGQLSNKLSKGTITAYNKPNDVQTMLDEMLSLKRFKRANDVINLFNTTQKKLLKSIELNDSSCFILNRFSTLSDTKKLNFIRKMSTIEDVNEILTQMSFLINLHYDWNHDSFINFVNNSNNFKCEIVFDERNIVIVRCDDYETIKHIAKTTNWCISKNKQYWNNYMSDNDNLQYVLLDFNKEEDDELSIVGFTKIKRATISHAHTFTNNSMMDCESFGDVRSFKNFTNGNIFNLLETLEIPSSLYMNVGDFKYEWNKESFMAFLKYAIGDDYIVLMDDGDKFVFQTNNSNVRFLIKNYSHVFDNYDKKHIFFVDFSLKETDNNRILYSVIYRDGNEEVPNGSRAYNVNTYRSRFTFDYLLDAFNLPYDTICRVCDKTNMIVSALRNFNLGLFEKYLSDDEFRKHIESKALLKKNDEITNHIYNSVFMCGTVDFIESIYVNGYQLSSFITSNNVDSLVREYIYNIGNYLHGKMPSKDDMDNMYSPKVHISKRCASGYFHILSLIIQNEKKLNYKNLINTAVNNLGKTSEFKAYIVNFVFNKANFSVSNDVNNILINHFITMNNMEYIDILRADEKLHEKYKKIISERYSVVNV